MKVEKVPLTKMEARAEKLESDKQLWQNLKTRMSDLTNQCASLYNYDNPFGERVVSSSDSAVTATASRNAELTQHTVKVIQTAAADKIISEPIESATQIDAGHYVFTVGKKDVSYFFNGGTLKAFVNGLNRRAPDLLRAQIIQAQPGEQVLLLEAKVTGAANAIGFEGDATELAQQIGWMRPPQSTAAPTAAAIETLPLSSFSGANPYNLTKTVEQCLINPNERISVPIHQNRAADFSLRFKVFDLKTLPAFQAAQKPFEPGVIASASFKDVTLTNDVSLFPQTEALPSSETETESIADSIRIFIDSNQGQRQLPLSEEALESFQTVSLTAEELGEPLNALRIENNSNRYTLILDSAFVSEQKQPNTAQPPQRNVNALECARDAVFEYDGIKLTRENNQIDDVNDQLTFTLHATTPHPVALKIETDAETVKDNVIQFAYHYNKLLEEINIYTTKDEKVIDELSYLDESEKKEKRTVLGALQGDLTLIQLKNRLSQIINSPYDIQSPDQISMLYQLGVGSNLSSYSGYSTAKMRGYLEIDEKKLDEAVRTHIGDLQKMFGYDSNNDYITDNGIAFELNQYLSSFSKQGGIIDGKIQTFNQQITQQEKSMSNFNDRMEKKEADYKRQFGNMEAMYERLKDSSRALDSLNQNSNNQ